MPRPGLQQKPAAAALSQAGRAGPNQPIRAIQPAGRTRRPPTGCTRQTSDVRQTSRQTDVGQYHRLMPPGRGIIMTSSTDFIISDDDITMERLCCAYSVLTCRACSAGYLSCDQVTCTLATATSTVLLLLLLLLFVIKCLRRTSRTASGKSIA